MAGISAYATPIVMPLISRKPLKMKMSQKTKDYFDDLFSRDVELFEDENTGELFSKVTDNTTGQTVIRKCEYVDED